MPQCAACRKDLTQSGSKCYTIRRGNERHLVCFCRECHSVFQEETRRATRNPKVGRAVKGVITGLGAIGVVVMTAIFAIGLFAFKQIMKTKFGGDSGGIGEPSSFQSSEPGFSFPKTFIGEEAGEPMLHDFEPNDLTGYEVTDDTGQVFSTDNLVNELFSEEDSFSDVGASFAEEGETSYGEDSASYR